MKRSGGGAAVLILSLGLWLASTAPVRADGVQADESAGADSLQSDGEEQPIGVEDRTVTVPADSTAAPADSIAATGLAADVVQPDFMEDAQSSASGPLLLSWDWEPKSGIKAEVRKVQYWGELRTNMKLDRNATVNAGGGYSWDEYRKQEKTVEKRDGNLTHNAGNALPVNTNLSLRWNWTEDNTVNSAGVANLNKNDTKMGTVALSKVGVYTGAIRHAWSINGSLRKQQGESQGKAIDNDEGIVSGGWRTKTPVTDGLAIATGLWGKKSQGEGVLGTETSPISADEDSLRFGVFYKRGLWHGYVNVKRSNFVRRYLDYNRNTSGLVDTTTPGVQKIVQELEQKDAISYEWGNQFRLGRLGGNIYMARDTGIHNFQNSGVGSKDRLQDQLTTDFSFRYSAQDSITFSFGYLWKWDDQTIKDATAPRGKQINQKRDFGLNVKQHLFRRSDLEFKFSQGLSQDIAEKQFNENDRDRLETLTSLRFVSDWDGRFRANFLLSYREAQDLSIRQSRSANNNIKKTFEISPGYYWPLAGWLTFQQNFLVSILFTDFVFNELPQVNRDDNYNKRGTLNTRVVFTPNQRLRVAISHDFNARFNATRTGSDATGNDLFHIDLEQRISKIDLALTYQVSPWLKLEGATFRTKDVKNNFGQNVSTVDNRSGEIWIGGTVNKSWGRKNPLTLAGTARNYHAYGPNVQESNKEYWDANISLSWKF
jgi:hypothetical protein